MLVTTLLVSGMTAFRLISVPPLALEIYEATGILMFISRDRAWLPATALEVCAERPSDPVSTDDGIKLFPAIP